MNSITDLIGKSRRFPAFSAVYGLEIDRQLRGMDQPPITFSAHGLAESSIATARLLKLEHLFTATAKPEGANTIYQAEMLVSAGKRSEAIAHAFTHAQGPQINGLNLFYANYAIQRPVIRCYYLNKYLSDYGLRVELEHDENNNFFYRLKSGKTFAKVDGPLVTVIMPAHNVEATIELALNSLLNQSWHNLQIIIVDDASTDSTRQKAKAIAKRDPRVEVLSNPVNVGAYVSRNLGVLHTRGEWLTVHDADDWAFPDRIEQQVKALTGTKAHTCTGGMLRMNAQGQITRPSPSGANNEDGYQRLCFVSLMVKTDAFHKELGAWDSVRVGGDAEMIARLKVLGDKSTHLGRPLMLCLDNPAGLTNDNQLGLVGDDSRINKVRLDYRKAYDKWHLSKTSKKLLPNSVKRIFVAPLLNIINEDDLINCLSIAVTGVNLAKKNQEAEPDKEVETEEPKDNNQLDASPLRIRLNLTDDDLIRKLWEGFSKNAKASLIERLYYEDETQKDKVKILCSLARWHATNNEWHEAMKYLEKAKKLDKSFFIITNKLLLIECYLHTNNFRKAEDIINYALTYGAEANYYVAKCNLICLQISENSSANRIKALNEIYAKHNLAKLNIRNYSEGFTFENIDCISEFSEYKNEPKISILFPLYNAADFLGVAITSLLNQTWTNIEIVAVDDCSTDDSWERLKLLAKKDNRIKIFRNEVNLGAYSTRNKALGLATGEYVTVHDSDDWSHPQMIEVQIQEMLADPNIKITFSSMARVCLNMYFMIRPQRPKLEYIHRSYPSILLKREDLRELGEWDSVTANADDELLQRARIVWGKNAIVDVLKDVPLSFFMVHENSLTQQAETSINTLTFGIRKNYALQADYWRVYKADSENLKLQRKSLKDPFPIPQNLAPKNWNRSLQYDIVIISDLSLLGGTRRCNEGYIEAASKMGWRIGLFHWPRYDLKTADIAKEYFELCYRTNIDLISPQDSIFANLILIHHPPILKFEIDAVPKIIAKKLGILVNQSPMQLWSEMPHYYDLNQVNHLAKKLFGLHPTWIPISSRVIQSLAIAGGFDNISPSLWHPPYNGVIKDFAPPMPCGFGQSRQIVLGRHSRDHWTKWPDEYRNLSNAYCAESTRIKVKFLGGAKTAIKMLGNFPDNWEVYQFDSIPVSDFLETLDFFIHYTHTDYIEEFGRNVMEAMVAGRVVMLPHSYEDVFGDSAIYVKPEEVESTILKYWRNMLLYKEQVAKGYRYVTKHCSILSAQKNLINFMFEGQD